MLLVEELEASVLIRFLCDECLVLLIFCNDVPKPPACLDPRQKMRDVRGALDNLWMVLAGIAAAEQDRRFRGEDGGCIGGEVTPEP